MLQTGGVWLDRIRGLRANASHCSQAELGESTGLDAGRPEEPGREYGELPPKLTVLGGR